MKKQVLLPVCILLLTLLCAAALADVNIDAAHFPDANFMQVVAETFDSDQDGKLSSREISEATYLDCMYRSISDLTGVEWLTELETLFCNDNDLTSLDISRNTKLVRFSCEANRLTALDVSSNTALTELNCSSNALSSLDVSSNTGLLFLSCKENQLSALDVSRNTQLEILYCSANLLTALDVSSNPKLTDFECSGNQLAALDVSAQPDLMMFDCSGNRLASLDVSGNPGIEILRCSGNSLTGLSLGTNPVLRWLFGHGNKLKEIDVSGCARLDDAVRNLTRKTENGYDCFRSQDDDVYFTFDRTVTVTAGSVVSKPSADPSKATVKGLNYRLDSKKKTAVFTGPQKKSVTSVTVPATVRVDGKTYKVTEIAANACKNLKKLASLTVGKNVSVIGKNAFYGCKKLKTVTFRTTKLTSSGVKSNAFKGIYKKAVVRCPEGRLKAYKKLLLKKGVPKTAKFK